MYQIILAPLDGSPRAEKILPHVENLALSYKSRVFYGSGAAAVLQRIDRPLLIIRSRNEKSLNFPSG